MNVRRSWFAVRRSLPQTSPYLCPSLALEGGSGSGVPFVLRPNSISNSILISNRLVHGQSGTPQPFAVRRSQFTVARSQPSAHLCHLWLPINL